MNLLIDVGAIKTGGGAQLALNFLDLLAQEKHHQKWVVLVPKTGPLANFAFDKDKFVVYVYPNNYVARFWLECTELKQIVRRHKITHFYTFFGAGLPHNKIIRSVVTTAYPLICYPESPFWNYAGAKSYWKNRINNILRRMRLRRASTIIVETEVMKSRVAQHVPFEAAKILVLPPVPSRYLQEFASNPTQLSDSAPVNFILVSGCDPHKNLWRLPEIAVALEKIGLKSFIFTLTLDESRFLQQHRINQATFARVRGRFRFLGSIDPRNIQVVYQDANFLLNISDLESFSNNYMEAWKAGLPIIASDRDFAHGICGASAWYVEPHEPNACAHAIIQLVNSPQKQQQMLVSARQKLAALGDERQRFARVMAILADDSPSPVPPSPTCLYERP